MVMRSSTLETDALEFSVSLFTSACVFTSIRTSETCNSKYKQQNDCVVASLCVKIASQKPLYFLCLFTVLRTWWKHKQEFLFPVAPWFFDVILTLIETEYIT